MTALTVVHSIPFAHCLPLKPVIVLSHLSLAPLCSWNQLLNYTITLITYPHSTHLLLAWSIAIQSTAPFVPDIPDEIVPYHCPSLSFLHFAHLHLAVPSISGPNWYDHPCSSSSLLNCWIAATFLSTAFKDGCLIPPPIHPIVALANNTSNKAKQYYNIDQGPVKVWRKSSSKEVEERNDRREPRSLLFHVIKRIYTRLLFSAAVIYRHCCSFLRWAKITLSKKGQKTTCANKKWTKWNWVLEIVVKISGR